MRKMKIFLVEYDQVILFIVAILTLFGLFLQLNIGSSLGDNRQMNFFINQLKWVFISLPFFIFFFRYSKVIDLLYKFSFVFIIILIALLVMVLVKGISIQGGTRWIRIFGFTIQPSTLAHPALIIFFAKFLEKKRDVIKDTGIAGFIKNFWFLILVSAIVFLLIALGRHLSTLIVLGLTLFTMLFVAEFKFSLFIILILLLGGFLYFYISDGAAYRLKRIEIYSKYSLFLKALGYQRTEIEADDYQVRESLTAISRGGLTGTGITRGRAKHKYLPDINSDYVFALIAEQFGFIGSLITVFLYCIFIFRVFLISSYADSFFKKLLIFGFGANLFITVLVNVGVSISALPSTGLPLPFISYGGSYLLTSLVMVGIILNVSSKRKSV